MKYLIILAAFLLPTLAFAAALEYTPIVGIPGWDSDGNFNSLIKSLYALSISIAALLAVIKIVIAGVKYMMSDVVTSKADAKKDISGSLIGLVIVLGAVLILTVINPNLTSVNLTFNQADPSFTPPEVTAATNYGPYNAVLLNTDDEDSILAAETFKEDCLDNGGEVAAYARFFSSDDQEVRCFDKGPTGNSSIEKACSIFGVVDLFTKECKPSLVEEKRQECEDPPKGGVYTTDPQRLNYGICLW